MGVLEAEEEDGGPVVVGYEEIRRKRIEENMKRMKELGLVELSKSLATPAKTRSPMSQASSAMKKKQRRMAEETTEARRSSRVASKPAVDYRDQTDLPGLLRGGRQTRGDRQGLPRKYMSDRARMAAIDAADEVARGLQNPAFVKPMLHSHTASGFWLGLPAVFSKTHLPLRDDRMMLEDAQEREWETIYLAGKVGLSGGWRGFSLDHELVDGDCCIFELVSSHRFKVHIFRAHELDSAAADEEEEAEAEEAEHTKVQNGNGVKKAEKKSSKKGSATTTKGKKVGSKSGKKGASSSTMPKTPKLENEVAAADGGGGDGKPSSSVTRAKKKVKAKDDAATTTATIGSLSANNNRRWRGRQQRRSMSDNEEDEDQEETDAEEEEEDDANKEEEKEKKEETDRDGDGGAAPSTPSQKAKGESKSPLGRKRKSEVITLGSEDSKDEDSEDDDDNDDDDDKWEPTGSTGSRRTHSRACRTPVRATRNSGAR